MLVSLKWLQDYVDIGDLQAEQVAALLTDLGLEVESLSQQSTVPKEVVVGKVINAVPHPNADSLRLCTVDIGEAEPLSIVCGAPNARTGIKVAVATIGAVLPGDFKIKKSKIRGETSFGMLCSEKELNLSDEHEGIIELPETATIGKPVAAVLGLDDAVLEIKVTPNRADCLGYLGIARDLAARLGRPFKEPVPEPPRDPAIASKSAVTVKIADNQACSRFIALYIKDVKPGPSPAWMQKRLTAAGMRPINAIVDVTNYVMLEYGQPIHAYDARYVRGRVIEVRDARPGETVRTLDDQERQLADEDIVIADAEGVLGLAGIMGGASSEVRDDTSELIVEVACFAPHRVRRTAKRLGMHTEASHRFERGVDVDALARVAWRAAELIAQAARESGAGARVAHELVDLYPGETQKRVVALRLSRVRQLLAQPNLSRDEIVRSLEALEYTFLDGNEDRLVFEIPFFRLDVEREADLIEEVARLVGYDKIPRQLPVMNIQPTPEDPFVEFQEEVRLAMAAAGFRETISFPFVSEKEYADLGVQADHPLYPSLVLKNPLSEQHRRLQSSLVPGLLRATSANRRRGEHGARLFELGRGYFAAMADSSAQQNALTRLQRILTRPSRHVSARARGDQGRPIERHWMAAILDQPYAEKTWNQDESPASFYHGKAAVVALLKNFGAPAPELRPVAGEDGVATVPYLHPGAGATIYVGGKYLGYVGELHPEAALALDFEPKTPPVILELDLEQLYAAKGQGIALQNEMMRFPPITRDLAFLVDKTKTHADFEAKIRAFKRRRYLRQHRLFDIYQGDKLPEGMKSMAYTLYFQSPERTLTEQDVEPELTALVNWLQESLGATQR